MSSWNVTVSEMVAGVVVSGSSQLAAYGGALGAVSC